MEIYYFFALLLKHAIIDIGVQRHLGYTGKHRYWHKKPQLHYIGHGLGTILVLSPLGITTALGIGIFDWLVHWQIDSLKSKANNHFELAYEDIGYWWLLTIDQVCHYITYLIIILFFIGELNDY